MKKLKRKEKLTLTEKFYASFVGIEEEVLYVIKFQNG